MRTPRELIEPALAGLRGDLPALQVSGSALNLRRALHRRLRLLHRGSATGLGARLQEASEDEDPQGLPLRGRLGVGGRKGGEAKDQKKDREDRKDSHHECPPLGSNQISGQMIPSSRFAFDTEALLQLPGSAAALQHV